MEGHSPQTAPFQEAKCYKEKEKKLSKPHLALKTELQGCSAEAARVLGSTVPAGTH